MNPEIITHLYFDRIDSDVIAVVQTLNNQQRALQLSQDKREVEVRQTMLLLFPWLLDAHLRTQPNVFLYGGAAPPASTVLLQSHRAPPLHQCLLQSRTTDRQAKGPLMTSDARQQWHEADHSFKARISFHSGQYSAGLCSDFSPGSCSMLGIFREPYARVLSSHEYCKSATADELCRVANANELSLREWALHQGSLLLQQLTFHPSVCNATVRLPNASQSLRPAVNSPLLLEPREFPCWYKQKLLIDGLTEQQRSHLVDFVTNQLDKWFSVIGIVEEFDNSVRLIEHAYDLSPGVCLGDGVREVEVNLPSANPNASNRKRAKREVRYDNDPDYVRYDSQVRRSLAADSKIYAKVKELYQRQARIFSNAIVH